jgi:hypothetical protein
MAKLISKLGAKVEGTMAVKTEMGGNGDFANGLGEEIFIGFLHQN